MGATAILHLSYVDPSPRVRTALSMLGGCGAEYLCFSCPLETLCLYIVPPPSPPPCLCLVRAERFALMDVDGDRDLDVLLMSEPTSDTGPAVLVCPNRAAQAAPGVPVAGASVFSGALRSCVRYATLTGGNVRWDHLAVLDANGDGRLDLLLTPQQSTRVCMLLFACMAFVLA
jgi:hypothetical protein